MPSPREKKVHYERGTKEDKSSYRHSRDSGVGSSSTSDRASLGTPPKDVPFSRHQIENQRYNLSAVQEALDAAYEKIRQLEQSTARLDDALADSNKKNRQLKREGMELMSQVEALTKEEKRSRRESRTERNSPPRRDEQQPPSPRRIEEGSQTGPRRTTIRRESVHERLPTVPQAPYNPAPNPFTPRPASGSYIVPVGVHGPPSVTYSPAALAYNPTPSPKYPNDGLYHPYPL
jgi:hypothetical protein